MNESIIACNFWLYQDIAVVYKKIDTYDIRMQYKKIQDMNLFDHKYFRSNEQQLEDYYGRMMIVSCGNITSCLRSSMIGSFDVCK